MSYQHFRQILVVFLKNIENAAQIVSQKCQRHFGCRFLSPPTKKLSVTPYGFCRSKRMLNDFLAFAEYFASLSSPHTGVYNV